MSKLVESKATITLIHSQYLILALLFSMVAFHLASLAVSFRVFLPFKQFQLLLFQFSFFLVLATRIQTAQLSSTGRTHTSEVDVFGVQYEFIHIITLQNFVSESCYILVLISSGLQ